MLKTKFSTIVFSVLSIAFARNSFGCESPAALRVEARTATNGFIDQSTEGPLTVQMIGEDASAIATADYAELKVLADSAIAGQFAFAEVWSGDTLSISLPEHPTAVTAQFELTWHLAGNIEGDTNLSFSSIYNVTDPCDFNAYLSGGSLEISSPGIVDQLVTFIYEDVPIGENWKLDTRLSAGGTDPFVGVADFADTATLVSAQAFVENTPVEAVIVSHSGSVYPVPEPSSAAIALAATLCLTFRRHRFLHPE